MRLRHRRGRCRRRWLRRCKCTSHLPLLVVSRFCRCLTDCLCFQRHRREDVAPSPGVSNHGCDEALICRWVISSVIYRTATFAFTPTWRSCGACSGRPGGALPGWRWSDGSRQPFGAVRRRGCASRTPLWPCGPGAVAGRSAGRLAVSEFRPVKIHHHVTIRSNTIDHKTVDPQILDLFGRQRAEQIDETPASARPHRAVNHRPQRHTTPRRRQRHHGNTADRQHSPPRPRHSSDGLAHGRRARTGGRSRDDGIGRQYAHRPRLAAVRHRHQYQRRGAEPLHGLAHAAAARRVTAVGVCSVIECIYYLSAERGLKESLDQVVLCTELATFAFFTSWSLLFHISQRAPSVSPAATDRQQHTDRSLTGCCCRSQAGTRYLRGTPPTFVTRCPWPRPGSSLRESLAACSG